MTAAPRILQGAPVALLTTRHRGNSNVLPIAWHMPLSVEPPLVAVAIEKTRYSLDLVLDSEEFALNFPGRALLHHVQYLGSLRGEDIDKFEATQLETFDATHITAPLIHDCVAWIECELREVHPFGDHLLCVGQAVRIDVLPDAFGERWQLGPEELRPLHFLAGNEYSALDGVLEARLPKDYEAPERALREFAAEELELTEEARERREEYLGELQKDVEAGNVVDMASERFATLQDDDSGVNLTLGVLLGEPPADD